MSDAPPLDLSALVEPVQAIAREAGRRIMEVYAGGFSVTAKADQSPVTEADMAAHRCILRGLAELNPDIPILSEEASEVSFAERRRWDWLWLVDTLDGTREVIRPSDQFAVNIALIHQHEAVFGLILPPVEGSCRRCEPAPSGSRSYGRNVNGRSASVSETHPPRVGGVYASSWRPRPLRCRGHPHAARRGASPAVRGVRVPRQRGRVRRHEESVPQRRDRAADRDPGHARDRVRRGLPCSRHRRAGKSGRRLYDRIGQRNRLRRRQPTAMPANFPRTCQMSFRSGRIALALLLAAFLLSACAQAERPVTCHSHKVSNGELTECN